MIVEPKNSKVVFAIQFPQAEMSGCGFHIYVHRDLIKWLKSKCSQDGALTWTPDFVKCMGQKWFKTEYTYAHFLISRSWGLVSICCDGNACGLDLSYYHHSHAEKEDIEWIEYSPHNVDHTHQAIFLAAMASWLDGYYEAVGGSPSLPLDSESKKP